MAGHTVRLAFLGAPGRVCMAPGPQAPAGLALVGPLSLAGSEDPETPQDGRPTRGEVVPSQPTAAGQPSANQKHLPPGGLRERKASIC